jgi:hypothetical protein
MYKTQHLQIHLNLHKLVLDDAPKQTVRTVLDLDQDPRAILTLLDPVNLSTDRELYTLNSRQFYVVKRIVADEADLLIHLNLVRSFVL